MDRGVIATPQRQTPGRARSQAHDLRAGPAPIAISASAIAPKLRICSTSEVAASSRPLSSAASDAAAPRAAGGRDQLNQMIRAHSPYVAGLAYRLMGRDDEVDDVVQDVFLAYFRFHGAIREQSAVRGWLATTTVRVVRRRLRLRRIGLLLRLQDRVDPSDLHSFAASPEDCAVLTSIHRVLDSVGVNDRIAWILRYLEQEQIDDVARICRCSPATAKRRIAAAHSVVKRALGDD
jgi:RNA polymerase sigma-70 factor (ECF subfamily)